ncbi:DUF1996 domain-containing protein [Streptomyces yaizuensis]|uniref:DUF1996 domain-containing protein n=1 Tax=Streptomyces yaizuensis TaxID=2989713 RepID=A0ABQ5NUI4_9ACTN|nr:DUF1996 domain-containing protein [Streptomyces sp. YSPA8]GLF94024.1 DUF1996 domain-containing protein [Streptomyces sp. YSPA8]
MGHRTRKRSRLAHRLVVASLALALGGGGLVAVQVYAVAGEDGAGPPGGGLRNAAAAGPATVDCPEAARALPRELPPGARAAVDRELALIDTAVADAYRRLAGRAGPLRDDPGRVEREVLGPLDEERRAALGRIAAAVGQGGGGELTALGDCSLRGTGDDGGDGDGDGDVGGPPGPGGAADQSGQGNGPGPSDFADIRTAPQADAPPRPRDSASTGSFTSDCGVNANGLRNPDNVIVAPGVSNGAHHMHDYIGNQANDAFAGDDDLAAARTTCRNPGDRSSYYWPVLRLRNGRAERDADADGGGRDGNVGEIRTPAEVTLEFTGSPVGEVTAMPRLLRIITGDAKAFVNGPANANASWSCTGFEDRQLRDKYPICPGGSRVVRTFRFQSCWDGRNTDSADHRSHVAFADREGRCGDGFRAIPRLVQRIVYDVPPGPGFAVDSFPEQLHKPVTDHGDFINVFDEQLMDRVVRCVNSGRRCR